MSSKLPFEQPTPSWRERKKAKRRQASRRAALSAAMPAPDPHTRMDPLTGQLAIGPAADTAPQQTRRRPLSAMQDSGDKPPASSPGQLREFLSARKQFWSSLWRSLLAGLVTALALTAGLPVLGHRWHPEWLVGAAVVVAFLIPGVVRRWGLLSFLQRIGTVLGGLSVVVFAVVGLISNPVVIDGTVYAETSSKAAQARYAQQLRSDLLTLGDMDKYLAASTAEAWSRTDDIKQAKAQAESIGQYYQDIIDGPGVPEGAFGPATTRTVGAAYAMSKALELRLNLLEAGDDKLAEDLAAARTIFREEWNAAGEALGQAAGELNIPLLDEKGPVE